jgi:hypothetical protein
VNFSRAFSYAFEDRDWIAKLVMTFVMTLGAALLTPLLIGLALWAALLGYQAELVRNIRSGIPNPLPRWDNLSEKISRGGNILAAVIVYNIPNAILGCCVFTLSPTIGDTFTGAGVTLGLACCVIPMLLIYNLVTWPMLALGMGRYIDEGRVGVYFEFQHLFQMIQQNTDATIQYLLSSLLANIVFALFAIIPCIGWVAVPALAMPVHGALTGQYVGRVLGKPKAPQQQRPVSPAPRAPYRR